MSIAVLSRVVEELCAIVSGLDADALSPGDASAAVSVFVRGEHLCAAGKALCAQRATSAGEHRRAGHGDPAAWLAERSGEPTGAARDALEVAGLLGQLSGLEEALRAGELSTTKARTIAEAAAVDPSAEQALLKLSREGSLAELRDGAEAVKAAARSNEDDERRYEALRKGRHLRSFTGRDGGFKGQIALTPDDGARLLAALSPASDFFFDEARRLGRHDTHEAYLADALVAVVTGEWPGEGAEDAGAGTTMGPVRPARRRRAARSPAISAGVPAPVALVPVWVSAQAPALPAPVLALAAVHPARVSVGRPGPGSAGGPAGGLRRRPRRGCRSNRWSAGPRCRSRPAGAGAVQPAVHPVLCAARRRASAGAPSPAAGHLEPRSSAGSSWRPCCGGRSSPGSAVRYQVLDRCPSRWRASCSGTVL